MPYFTCPSCRMTHYARAARSIDEACPRCEARLGKRIRLVQSESLSDARSMRFTQELSSGAAGRQAV